MIGRESYRVETPSIGFSKVSLQHLFILFTKYFNSLYDVLTRASDLNLPPNEA